MQFFQKDLIFLVESFVKFSLLRIRRITAVARKRNVIFVLTFVRIHVRISPVDVVFGGYALSTIWRTGSLVTTDFAIRAARRRFSIFQVRAIFFVLCVLLPSLPTRWMNPIRRQHNLTTLGKNWCCCNISSPLSSSNNVSKLTKVRKWGRRNPLFSLTPWGSLVLDKCYVLVCVGCLEIWLVVVIATCMMTIKAKGDMLATILIISNQLYVSIIFVIGLL